jgi:hypothetical protein
MDDVVALAERPTQRGRRYGGVERNLRQRGPDSYVANERRPQAAENPQTRERHVLTERIRHEIDRVAKLEQRADPMELAERRAPGLEKGLRRYHEDFHGLICGIVRKLSGNVNVSLAISAG